LPSSGVQLEALTETRPTLAVGDRSPKPRWRSWALSLVLVATTFAVYYPVHSYPFINFDDNRYVTENPHIQQVLDWSMVKWALLHPYLYNWHPLTWISHALDIQMFGLDAGRHHEVNVLLHALSTLLVFWVLARATGAVGCSFVVAALFAVHPINVESVAWIAERKTVLSTPFFLLALGAYGWYARDPRLRRMMVVAILYGLGLMAKPQVITLPLVLLLWDYWPLRRMFADAREPGLELFPARSFSTLVKEKIPLFFIGAVDAVLTMIAQHAGSGPTGPYTLPIRLGNAAVSYVRYIGKFFWPTNLAILYLHPLRSLRWGQVLLAVLCLLAISGLVAAGRRHRYLVVGWLWFLVTLLPMIGLVHFYLHAMADRYAYIACIGILLMVCWGATELAERVKLPRAMLSAASVAALLALSLVTHRQVTYWKDSITLWTHTLQVTQPNWVAEQYLGSALLIQGQRAEALGHYYRAAAEMTQRESGVYLGIATAEQQGGNPQVAIEYYKKALAVVDVPDLRRRILWNMGLAYRDMGDAASAQDYFYQSVHQPPLAMDWQGDWWLHIGPMLRDRVRQWRSGQPNAPSQ